MRTISFLMRQDGRDARHSGVNNPTASEVDYFQAARFQNSSYSFRCSDAPIVRPE